MPRHCTVCQSGLRSAIDRDLTLHHTVRTVARRYGLSKSSVARHWAHHRQDTSTEAAALTRLQADINRLQAQLLAGLPSLGLPTAASLHTPRMTLAPATGPGYLSPAKPPSCPTSTDLEDAAGYTPFRHRVESIRHPYVPRWLPFRLEREFLERFRQAMQRAKARRGGRWRSHLDEVLTTGRILGGLHTAYRYGRIRSEWGRRMRSKRGQKALQHKLAMQGEQRSEAVRKPFGRIVKLLSYFLSISKSIIRALRKPIQHKIYIANLNHDSTGFWLALIVFTVPFPRLFQALVRSTTQRCRTGRKPVRPSGRALRSRCHGGDAWPSTCRERDYGTCCPQKLPLNAERPWPKSARVTAKRHGHHRGRRW